MKNQIELPYGKSHLRLSLPDELEALVINPASLAGAPHPHTLVRAALQNPIDQPKDSTRNNASRYVVIAVNDKTRPVPHDILLPPLLEWLELAGYTPEEITFVIATGTHAPMPAEEFSRILPSAITERYRVVSHDCDADNLVTVGVTTRGTVVRVNPLYHSAGLKIVVGNIEPHHFAGFSGGEKTAAIGLTGRETINHNHAMLIDPYARMGEFERNPLRQDIEEIGGLIGTDYALNAVLNSDKQLLAVYFGSPGAVIRAGITTCREVTQTRINHRYDVVIASAGGHPKDINFYQAQKALTYAAQLVRGSGVIILAAACPEGSGSPAYERFMRDVHSYDEVFKKFARVGFQVGPHKALQVAKIGQLARVLLVSAMPPELVRSLLLTPVDDLDMGVRMAMQDLPARPQVAILPYATNTIPVVDDGG